MKVDRLCTEAIVAAPDEHLTDVAWRMQANNVGCVPVVDGNELVGIITERDVTRAFAQFAHAHDALACHFMTPHPLVIESGADVRDAALAMIAGGVRHLPLMKHGRVKGVVSIRDLMHEAIWTDTFPDAVTA